VASSQYKERRRHDSSVFATGFKSKLETVAPLPTSTSLRLCPTAGGWTLLAFFPATANMVG